jgi:PAS domain S-box-containing protein
MLHLDIRTIVFSNVITNTVCTLVIWVLWRQSRKRFPGTGFWVFDFVFQTTALILIILRGHIPDWMSIVLPNTLVLAGALLGYMGLERFVGKKTRQIHNYSLLLVFASVHAYFTWVQPDLGARNLNLSVGLLMICFQCLWLLLFRVDPGRRRLTLGVGLVFGAYSLVSLVRMAAYFSGKPVKPDYFQSGAFDSLVLVSYQMLFILLTYGLVLMFNKRLLVEVQTQEEKFSKAFHSSPNAIILSRLSDGHIIEVNDGFVKISGYNAVEALGETTIDLHLWDKEEDRVLAVNELSQRGQVPGREFQFRKKSGERIFGLFSAEIIRIDDQTLVLSSISDISGIKGAEEALRRKTERLQILHQTDQAILQTLESPEAIAQLVLKHLRSLLFCQRASLGLFDPEKKEMRIFAVEADGQTIMPAGMDLPEEAYGDLEILRQGRMEIVEDLSLVTRPPSAVRVLQTEGLRSTLRVPLLSARGLIGVLLVGWEAPRAVSQEDKEIAGEGAGQMAIALEQARLLQEIKSQATELEQRVLERTAQLESANQELEAFAYSVSHDLRSPLRAVDGFVRILLEDFGNRLDAEGKRLCAVISQSARDMGRLIDDLLAFSRIGRSVIQPSPMDMAALAQSIFYEVTTPENRERIDFLVGPLPSAVGDPTLIRLVWINLLSNAVKFCSKKERAAIEVGCLSNAECGMGNADFRNETADGQGIEPRPPNLECVYFVRDNGAGFDMAYADKLFGVFQRLHSHKEFEGTGVGLAIVQRIIHRHGGQVWAEGKEGQGATFYFTLST